MRRPVLAALSTAIVALIAGCGSSTSSPGGGGATPTSESTAAGATPAAQAIAISSATVSGVGTVLVDANGHTLYRFAPEASGTIACTGQCASNWPPAVVPPGAAVAPQGSLPGHFSTVNRPDGSTQATYNGWPLYAYGGDTAPGQANGQGKLGKWFAVTPDVAPPGAAASPTM